MNAARTIIGALALCTATAAGAAAPMLRNGTFSPPRAAPDFSLQGSNGGELTLQAYRGKVVALGFGFTSCPDVCPTTLAVLARARKALGRDAHDFQVIYVTVDPERDDAARLRAYLTAFDPSFVGATGAARDLARVRDAYGILASRKEVPGNPAAYQVHHSSYVYLVDRDGALRAMVPFGVPAADIAHDVKALLSR